MRKYEIAIIDENVVDALTLKNIINASCMSLVNVNCFLNLDEAVISINRTKPDIIILDVMFRNNTLFSFYKLFQLNGIKILFTTDKTGNSRSAAEKKNTDFIYKPFKSNDVILSINKTLGSYLKTDYSDTVHQLDLVTIASLDKIDFVDMKDIVFCAANGKYTTFHLLNGREIISSKNLGEYEKILNELFFYRVHHSYIINIKHLISVIKNQGTFCKLIDNATIPIAKRKQSDFNKFISCN